jgi:hypothetical protein
MGSKSIGANVYEPMPRNYKDKAKLTVIHCSLPEQYTCPLFAKGQCIEAQKFLTRGCVYGKTTVSMGYTRRAQGFRKKVKEFNEKARSIGQMLNSAPCHLAKIGEYVYLPYAHMGMCEAAPFVAHGGAFRIGMPFILAQQFNAQVIVALAMFVPYALLGEKIKDYQSEVIPRFLLHLSQDMRQLYAEAISLMPSLEGKTLKPESIKQAIAHVQDVKPYTEIGNVKGHDAKYGKWEWDGNTLTIKYDGAGGSIFFMNSEIDGQMSVTFKPTRGFKVQVMDESEIERLFHAGKLMI